MKLEVVDFLIILALVWILAAIYRDFKKREIPNWLNFSLLIFALAFRFFYSVFSNDYGYILWGLIGFGVFFVLANLFYYGRLFAGGDAKLMMALGAIILFTNSWFDNMLIGFLFVICLLSFGAIYSTFFSVALAFGNMSRFSSDFRKRIYENKTYLLLDFLVLVLFIIFGFFTNENMLFLVGAIIFALPFVYYYTKSVEQSCLLKYISHKDLMPGDWLAREIKFKIKPGNKVKVISPSWEGLSAYDISLIKKYYNKQVLIKQGIPFSPAFLLAFIVLILIKYLWASDWGLWQFF
ncbi:prepilin peptidase [Candidatus Pacearchaeota archaeon]|nr:prepilin peptidase [Candidatus Pacearchaeota archaeon]